MTAGAAALAVGAFPSVGTPDAGPRSTPSTSTATPVSRTPTEIGHAFLADYLDRTGPGAGRIVRRDQGGDTVSEGQAYGMLIAVGVRDRAAFASIWAWTEAHLRRSDGLLAWRYDMGRVVDDQPASDADLDVARSLILAGDAFHDPDYTAAGRALAGAILDHLTVMTPDGRILLPGLWAKGSGPWSYNPSYAAPATFVLMAKTTKDPRWAQLVTGSRSVTAKILGQAALPSDWAQVKVDGAVVPLPSATGSGGSVLYGYDAGRLPVRYAESCAPADVALAARLAGPLGGKDPLPMRLDLGGTAVAADQSPLGYVARAAARAVSGDSASAQADLRAADRLAQSVPTYYGSAWDALGSLQLTTTALGDCAPLKGE